MHIDELAAAYDMTRYIAGQGHRRIGFIERGAGHCRPPSSNDIAMRRIPEQALGILYASAASVSSGAFFPAGVNGTIRVSGANSF